MGVTDGEAFSNAVGYNVTSTSTPGTTVSVTDTSENAVASGIKRMSGMFFDFKRCGNLVP